MIFFSGAQGAQVAQSPMEWALLIFQPAHNPPKSLSGPAQIATREKFLAQYINQR
jgi:hypothetical protein